MKEKLELIKNRAYYYLASIKNRYPCKIVGIGSSAENWGTFKVIYRAITKFNIVEASAQEIMDDPMLIEKFHPTDAVKLGFIAAGEVLLKDITSIELAKETYEKIVKRMMRGDENENN